MTAGPELALDSPAFLFGTGQILACDIELSYRMKPRGLLMDGVRC